MVPSCVEEIAVACLADELRRCVNLLSLLDSLGGHSTAQWGEVRVQGGSKVPVAETRAEVAEALAAMPKKLVKVAEKIRGCPPASQRGRYVFGLLNGQSGNDLQRSAGLTGSRMEECRRWLKGIMATCRV